MSLVKRNIDFSFDILNNYLKGDSKKKESFIQFCKNELEKLTMSVNSKKQQLSSLNRLSDFKPNCTFLDLNYSFISGYYYYINSLPQVTSQNTVWGYHKNLKKFINIAVKKGFMDKNPYQDFRVKTAPT